MTFPLRRKHFVRNTPGELQWVPVTGATQVEQRGGRVEAPDCIISAATLSSQHGFHCFNLHHPTELVAPPASVTVYVNTRSAFWLNGPSFQNVMARSAVWYLAGLAAPENCSLYPAGDVILVAM